MSYDVSDLAGKHGRGDRQSRPERQRPGIGGQAAGQGRKWLNDLTEGKSQQARTQERQADRRQGQKSVGDSVVVAHDTPTTRMLVRIY